MAAKIRISPIHEQVILGTMLSNKELRTSLSKTLTAGMFYVNRHRVIFSAIQCMDRERLEYIPSTLKTFLPTEEEEWGGPDYIEKIITLSANENIDYHIARAKWDTIKNSLISEDIPTLLAKLQDPKIDPGSILHSIKNIERMIGSDQNNIIISGKQHVARYNAELYARGGADILRTTGYPSLDRELVSPCKPGMVSVIAAAPSIGKTTFCLNMAARQSKRWKVGYMAWESGAMAATDIVTASMLKIPLPILMRHPDKLSLEERKRKDELMATMFGNDSSMSFIDRPPRDVIRRKSTFEVNDAILDWLDGVLEIAHFDMIYWDLFEKMFTNRKPEAIMLALDRIQEMAQRHQVHFILLHQILLKEAEKQQDKRPTRYNLKGSGGYIEIPDFVFGLYRRAVYERGIEDNELEVICLKQRTGHWPFKMIFEWEGKYGRVSKGRKEEMTFINQEEFDEI